MKYIIWIPIIGLIIALLLSFKDDDGLEFFNDWKIKWGFVAFQGFTVVFYGFYLIA